MTLFEGMSIKKYRMKIMCVGSPFTGGFQGLVTIDRITVAKVGFSGSMTSQSVGLTGSDV